MQTDAYEFLNKIVDIRIDRPLGSAHPTYRDMIYPVNYGYIPNTVSGDGEEIDVYLLGVDRAVDSYTAQVIALIHRKEDTEQKLIAVPPGMQLSTEEIREAVSFQEQYFQSVIERIGE